MLFVLATAAACLALVLLVLRVHHVRRTLFLEREREVAAELAQVGARLRERLAAAREDTAASQ